MNPYRSSGPSKRGFALVVSLSLMVLMAVICVGLLGLSAISMRDSAHDMAIAEARANARLALTIAIGELQSGMGPDQRISARAETLAKLPGVEVGVPSSTAKAWWVGASHSDPDQSIGSADQPVTWLVSGLDMEATSAQQLSQSLERPVPLYGRNSIDIETLTGGEEIEAGTVLLQNRQGKADGGFAWWVDDNGLKAQLAAVKPEVRNDLAQPHGGGMLPGTHDLGFLDQMGDLEGTPWETYHRLNSLNDLPLIGGDGDIVRAKRMSYTIRSWGVLSDVRKGGLKRDLTIAFENESVFDAVFPKGRGGFGERYVVMDADKLGEAGELRTNGYIHWDMFKDYYNLKRYIARKGTMECLDAVVIPKNGLTRYAGVNADTPFAKGQLGPHGIGPNGDVPAEHRNAPYGDFSTVTSKGSTESYKHSPLLPVLSRMQQNAWVDFKTRPSRLRTNVQLWVAQYNPYNIGINVTGTDGGSRIIDYPQVYITAEGTMPRRRCLDRKLESSVPHDVVLGAGRGHVLAFKESGTIGMDKDGTLFDDKVKDLTLQSIYSEHELTNVPRTSTLTFEFVNESPSVMHGANSRYEALDHEISQVLWTPFAWNNVNNRAGKRITMPDVPRGEWNENRMASFSFHLRSTRESGSSVRPLVDANIRAMFCNSRWDAPLGLDLLAAYSPQNRGETDEQIFQMSIQDSPKGYTFWGAGNDALDGFDRVILFDVPREDLVSLGQLQHANVGRFSYEPSYIVGNSHANPRIRQEDWRDSVADTFSTPDRGLAGLAIAGPFNLYDASYLVNEELWDSYIFTTIPQVADNHSTIVPDLPATDSGYRSLLDGESLLPNPRFLPYEPAGSKFDRATLQMASPSRGERGAFYHNAGHLLVDGMFNVNSTSVDAWEAFLSGTRGLPYQKLAQNGAVTGFSPAGELGEVRFPRVKSVLGQGTNRDSLDENFWTGFRSLEPNEVRELAVAIVEEIRKRGPFLTLGDFVNRRLERGELGEKGALQAALDETINKGLDTDFGMEARHPKIPAKSSQGAGFPGQLLQGDILQALSPYMTVRSDTFTIRAYGESREAGTGTVRSRAWCEATVQRYPDPVGGGEGSGDALDDLARPRSPFGRCFRITSFRWLAPNEI